jgi:hypothetical protein
VGGAITKEDNMETEKTNGNGTKAIEVYRPASMSAYEPRNSEEAFRIAQHFAASKLLGNLANPDAVFLVMAVGAELGIPATAALRGVYVVEGRPFVSADLMKSLCLRRRDVCEFFRLVKGDDKSATYSAKRVGDEPVTMTFSIDQAKRAGLVKDKSGWDKYPEAMLRHRCVAMLAREVFPDLVLGIYCEEEAAEIRASEAPTDIAPLSPPVVDAETVDPDARFNEWKARLEAAATELECNALRSEVKAANVSPDEQTQIAGMYMTAMKRIREAK